jgi:hypothetical protein
MHNILWCKHSYTIFHPMRYCIKDHPRHCRWKWSWSLYQVTCTISRSRKRCILIWRRLPTSYTYISPKYTLNSLIIAASIPILTLLWSSSDWHETITHIQQLHSKSFNSPYSQPFFHLVHHSYHYYVRTHLLKNLICIRHHTRKSNTQYYTKHFSPLALQHTYFRLSI